ncbi:hypothetical protein Tco_1429675 [Tanacetum coccineum]
MDPNRLDMYNIYDQEDVEEYTQYLEYFEQYQALENDEAESSDATSGGPSVTYFVLAVVKDQDIQAFQLLVKAHTTVMIRKQMYMVNGDAVVAHRKLLLLAGSCCCSPEVAAARRGSVLDICVLELNVLIFVNFSDKYASEFCF